MNFNNFFNQIGGVIINGDVIRGNDVIINGEKMSEKDLVTQNFDDQKNISMQEINTIKVDTSCTTRISSSDSTDLVAHLSGNATYVGKVKFNLEKNRDELMVTASLNGFFRDTNLVLDIFIPKFKKYDNISIETSSSKIEFLDSNVSAEKIDVDTSSGPLIIKGNFNKIDIDSSSANIDIKTEYADDLIIENSSGLINIFGNYKNILIDSSSSNCNIESDSVERLKFDSSSGKAKFKGGFKNITINATSTDIQINSKFNEYLKIDTSSSKIMLDGVYKDIVIETNHGKIISNIEAISDINISLEATSGNADFTLSNIKKVNISGDKISGKINNNRFERKNGYNANIRYEVVSCNITIN